MLGLWRSHADYQQQMASELSTIARFNPYALWEYEKSISKLYILNLDTLKSIIGTLYSFTGRPAINQPEIFRALVLMSDLDLSLDELIEKLSKNRILRISCGFFDNLPGIASFYDFMKRIVKIDEKPRFKPKKSKPKKKYGKNKMPHRRKGITQKLVDRILKGCRFNNRPERLLQEIFAKVCVQPSIDLGLVPKSIIISGDGTCIRTGASRYGRKTCKCIDFLCDCPRRFSDPNATWGWDSHRERYFYGYMGYFISSYNCSLKLDLPLYLRLFDACRHDSISAVISLAEFTDLYPNLSIETFISDSASDNYATYKLLHEWNINAVIALNKNNEGNNTYPNCNVNEKGIPICPANHQMVNWGFCHDRCRIKWRCPKACGKTERSCQCADCSPSDYGRVVYTKPEWDLRLFTRIPRGSDYWKALMKQRTAAERVNNRILHHYGLDKSKMRGKAKISIMATIAAINVHLDAQLAKMKENKTFNFDSVFGIDAAAFAA